MKISRICFFLPNGYGDLLMSVPTVTRLISHHGYERLVIVVNSWGHKELLEYMVGPRINIFVRKNGQFLPETILFLKLFFAKIDVIYAPHLSNTLINKIFFTLALKKIIVPQTFSFSKCIPWIIPIPLSLTNNIEHQVNFYTRFIRYYDQSYYATAFESIDMVGFAPIKRNNLLKQNSTLIDTPIRIAVAISCNPKERHKISTPETIAQALNLLSGKYKYEICIVGTPSDKDLISRFINTTHKRHQIRNYISNSITESLDLYNDCHIGICGTTGQGHMMAVVGLPLLVICGVTNPHESAPYVDRAVIVHHELPCGPCYQEGFPYGCQKIPCMDQIDPLECAIKIDKLIENDLFGLDWFRTSPRLKTNSPDEIYPIVKSLLSSRFANINTSTPVA